MLELLLACPMCRGALRHRKDTLTCGCGRVFPIVGGIPRLLPDQLARDIQQTQRSFSLEWQMFRPGERNWGEDIAERLDRLIMGFGVTPDDLRGKTILDAGCGSGELSVALANDLGMKVLAIDLARGIEQAAARNTNPNVLFVQGSVLNLPVQPACVDYLYCAGVLVHLPSSKAGFDAIVDTLKPGGRLFIWVYHPVTREFHPRDHYKMRVYGRIRSIVKRLPTTLQYWAYLSAIPAYTIVRALRGRDITWREKMQDFVDFFSPAYQNRHTPEEVAGWFREYGFINASVAYRGDYGFGFRGIAQLSQHTNEKP